MMEQLDYLIRTLTYKRSSLECDFRNNNYENLSDAHFIKGQISGLSIAITELYKMIPDEV